jgi:transcriptional regulator with XRE-family HTH domain
MKLGENIKKLRELKNYTQQYLADELDISLSGYGKIERDQTEITMARLLEIAKILEIDLFSLIHFNGNDVFKNGKQSKESKSTEPSSLSFDLQQQLIQKYKEENEYLKELVRQLMEKR